MMRKVLLWASENDFLNRKVPDMFFVKKALKKFMPGTELLDAVESAREFSIHHIPAVFTQLGENLNNLQEAAQVTQHYLDAVDVLHKADLQRPDGSSGIEISLKLTQLGLDHSFDEALSNFSKILKKAEKLKNVVWIDMESSSYVDTTLRFFRQISKKHQNAGLCLQAYLYRTKDDLNDLLPLNPNIRLVKGAYREPENIAFKRKADVDRNYYDLAEILLNKVKTDGIRSAFGTHDAILQGQIFRLADSLQLKNSQVEIQMLYGIKPDLQRKLAADGYDLKVLISYGEFWYPWYMRRLAERPANVMFVLKNIFS